MHGRPQAFALLVILFCQLVDQSVSIPRKLLCKGGEEACRVEAAARMGAKFGMYPPPLPAKPGQVYISELSNPEFIEQHYKLFEDAGEDMEKKSEKETKIDVRSFFGAKKEKEAVAASESASNASRSDVVYGQPGQEAADGLNFSSKLLILFVACGITAGLVWWRSRQEVVTK
ncbi:hypothetical protein CYMTET_53872 [Cymbomonas tetramitiformis]|uniref:Uncharacterized protein n=1 Tax=Cymbomonas tetramitiformis TaxID=36881 RepID=A0AAE0EPA8_9CHLO|nr:hypothetical protein CYMTET_53872 [Cymbomonas tetramitiformis]